MSIYSIALFLHIAGALVFFAALGVEWIGMQQLQDATLPEQVRVWMGIFKSMRGIGFASMLTTVLSGIYMMATVWGWVAWIIVAIGALILVIALSLKLTGPRMKAIGQALAAEKAPLTSSFRAVANHPLLWVSIQTRIAITLGIVFLKIAKPDLGGSLLTISIAIILGLVFSLPLSRRERKQEPVTN